MRHNYNYDGFTTILSTRCQSRRVARPRRVASPSAHRPGPAVRLARLFRSPGPRPGEVRNAPPGRRRGRPGGAHGRRVWGLAPHVLSDAGRLQATRARRPGPPETRAARCPQARRRRDDLRGDVADRGPRAQCPGAATSHSRSVWSRRAPAESRARLATRGKKTALSDPLGGPSGVPPTATLVASYEALRRIALGQREATDGPSLGLALLLRQGVAAWLHAWARCPCPAD